uniref:DNA-directed DNA polymerase n=1 Tax=Amanita pseudoporphyria TaxID=67725 RepID=A0A5Q0N423_9AGAR|nr:DNA polymerase type B [Amanita pseudoporphyria]QFZ98517.1 DNA polymerase type B [Amanita pseudoporphyria]
MNPLSIFKIPLLYSGSHQFHIDFVKLNNNVSEDTNLSSYYIKYKILYNTINPLECEVKIVLQEDPSITIYKLKDKLITVPKLEINEILVERTVMSKLNEVYIIDTLTNQILIVKKYNQQKVKGFLSVIKTDKNFTKKYDHNLRKFIVMDIESITNTDILKKDGDFVYFDPIIISAYDFLNNKIYCRWLRNVHDNMNSSNNFNNSYIEGLDNRISLLAEFISQFLDSKYHKYTIYAHNLSTFDIIFILKSLVLLTKRADLKLEPVMRGNKLISLKVRFGKIGNSYRYYIEFHDSLQILLSSLDKL